MRLFLVKVVSFEPGVRGVGSRVVGTRYLRGCELEKKATGGI
jgi:hypothetical protein